ncbi:MAG: 5-formyltetrahydrofolate cyclo-ligase [Clostridia bacterium]|nr:5-formyltetrahydrofolate cyclo-ligase [Clostridia bacterium]
MNNGLKFEKARIREEILEQRLAVPEALRAEADAAMIRRFLSLATFRFAEVLLLYAPIKAEPNVLLLCEEALKAKKKIAFPRCRPETSTMTFHIVSSPEELTKGTYGILEPEESAEMYIPSPDKHDICLVPAVCFDRAGYRIGYGKGYYDRYLSDFGGTTVGFILQRFLCDSLPRGRYDKAVDLIITEKGVFAPK